MTTHPSVATMKLVAGDSVLDFTNTVDCRLGEWRGDVLVDYADLVAWAVRVDVLGAGLADALLATAAGDTRAAERALERAKALREALYRIFLSESEGRGDAHEDMDLLNDWILRATGQRRLVADGAVGWRWCDGVSLDAVTFRVAMAATDLLLKRDRRPVRACPGPHCGWLFLDTTKGGRRLWCSSQGCGTRVRVARFRASA